MEPDATEAAVGAMRRSDIPWEREHPCRFVGGPHDNEFRHLPGTGRVLDPPEGPALVVHVGCDTDPTPVGPLEDVRDRPTWHLDGVYSRGEPTHEHHLDHRPTWRYVWTAAPAAHAPAGVANALRWEHPDEYDADTRMMRPGPARPRAERDHVHVEHDLGWPLTDGGAALRHAHRIGDTSYLCGDVASDARTRGTVLGA